MQKGEKAMDIFSECTELRGRIPQGRKIAIGKFTLLPPGYLTERRTSPVVAVGYLRTGAVWD
jgi:hypothetical protein